MIPYLLFPKWISSHRVGLPTGGKATRIYDKQNFQRYLENAFEGLYQTILLYHFYRKMSTFSKIFMVLHNLTTHVLGKEARKPRPYVTEP